MNPETLLLRQINPGWLQEGGVSPRVFGVDTRSFKPPSDKTKISAYNGDQYSAKESFDHYISMELSTAGVLAVQNQEVLGQELICTLDNDGFEGHVSIDYSACTSRGQIEKKAKVLKEYALKRGWLYMPGSTDQNIASDKTTEQ